MRLWARSVLVAALVLGTGAAVSFERQVSLSNQLVAAVNARDPAAVRSLLAQGADPRTRDYKGLPYVHRGVPVLTAAAAHGDLRTAELLLTHGADPNALDIMRYSALAYVAHEGSAPLAALLLRHGADPTDAQSSHPAPLTAIREGNIPLLKLLLNHGVGARFSLQGADLLSHVAMQDRAPEATLLAMVRLLEERGAPLDDRNGRGRTPLMEAAGSGHVSIMRYLLARGASPAVVDSHGKTALALAREGGRTAVVRLLEQALRERKTLRSARPDARRDALGSGRR